jgi:hypothetical protein
VCIGGAVACILAWWFLKDGNSAYLIAIFYGYGIMSLCNQAAALSEWVGGGLYTSWSQTWGVETAFALLVGVGGACTVLCWLVVPWLNRIAQAKEAAEKEAEAVATAGPN